MEASPQKAGCRGRWVLHTSLQSVPGLAEEALGADRLVFPGQASAPGVVSVVCQCYQVSERGVTVP